MRRLRRFPIAVTCMLGLAAGCTSPSPDQTGRLALEMPEHFGKGGEGQAASGWAQSLDDPGLVPLIREALEHNHNLQAAAARVMAAKAGAKVNNANRFPTFGLGANASRTKRTSSTGFSLVSPVNNNLGINGSLAWEADLWGKFANRGRAGLADFEASAADYRAAELSLAVNTAKSWYSAVEARLQLQLAEDSLRSYEENLEVLENGYRRGVTEALDVRLTRANVAGARSSVEQRRRQLDSAVRSLEVLLGRYPADELPVADRLPELTAPVPGGLPSNLLYRRPDLVASERRLAAAEERATEARKNRLPTISLTTSAGTSTSQLRDVLDPDSNVWSLAANLSAPIFQGGRLKAAAEQSRANAEAALAGFRQTALEAFREVEAALSAEQYLRDQAAAQRLASDESIAAEQLAWDRYQRGLTDIITVLESQRRAVSAQSTFLQVANQRLQNRLDLYLALAGDFEQTGAEENPTVATVHP